MSATQLKSSYAEASQAYEAAHKVWFNTPVHTEAGKRAKAELAVKREAYLNAYRAANPTHIAM